MEGAISNPWIKTPLVRSAALSRVVGCDVWLKLDNLLPMTTSSHMISKIQILEAQVIQTGKHWSDADRYLREELLAKDNSGVYVPPFDHPDIWRGNSNVMEEIEEDIQRLGIPSLDAVASERLGRLAGRAGTKVVAVETEGTASFEAALKVGELVKLDHIDSIATSLGASPVAAKSLEWGIKYGDNVRSVVLSDAESVKGMVWMVDEERLLVESACGVSVAVAINGVLNGILEEDGASVEGKNVVIVVCGGSNISLKTLTEYRERFGV
ncbi:hypothetical protein DID88_008799 [Monilinia fructigena]|uniref:L-serine ammonia-lyase n=1 Tax=Monilinia fructigena TaxID=38457 RepID=A0A395J6K7_9HELO|nr:hypothetical protein DID88_008799 [Monilinia fructigena]